MIEASTAQITFDLIMDEDMCFVEGCYRLFPKNWEIFIISRGEDIQSMIVEREVVWGSGSTGIVVKLPRDAKLNKVNVLEILSKVLGFVAWSEVRGPDSMQLR